MQTAPDVFGGCVGESGFLPNARISVSTVQALEPIPGVTVIAPTPGFGAYHGTVTLPDPPPPGLFETISAAFTQKPNPYVVPR